MTKFHPIFILVIILFTACGGGNSPQNQTAVDTNPFMRTFSFGNINDPTKVSSISPLNATFDNKHQFLYKPSEISSAGNITKLRLQRAADMPDEISCPNLTVRLSHTYVTSLGLLFDDNVNNQRGKMETVFDNTLVIPAGSSGEWFDIVLDQPFHYNWQDYLVVEIEKSSVCTGTLFYRTFLAFNDRHVFSAATNTENGVIEHNQTTAQTADNHQPWMEFVFDGGEKATYIPDPDQVFASGSLANNSSAHHQMLYLANEIDGQGTITGFALRASSTGKVSFTATVKMAHSNSLGLNPAFSDNFTTAPVVVADQVRVSLADGRNGWLWIPLENHFEYNGKQHLVVDITMAQVTGNFRAFFDDNLLTSERVLSSNDISSETGTVSWEHYFSRIRFKGAPIQIFTDGTSATKEQFSIQSTGRMNLYRSEELGSFGTITSVACRLINATVPEKLDNFKIIMGHTPVDTLVEQSLDNLADATTVFSGTLNINNSLRQGDWLEVPLHQPFAYSGLQNLVIWIGTTDNSNAMSSKTCRMSGLNNQYTAHTGIGAPDASTIVLENRKVEVQLKLQ